MTRTLIQTISKTYKYSPEKDESKKIRSIKTYITGNSLNAPIERTATIIYEPNGVLVSNYMLSYNKLNYSTKTKIDIKYNTENMPELVFCSSDKDTIVRYVYSKYANSKFISKVYINGVLKLTTAPSITAPYSLTMDEASAKYGYDCYLIHKDNKFVVFKNMKSKIVYIYDAVTQYLRYEITPLETKYGIYKVLEITKRDKMNRAIEGNMRTSDFTVRDFKYTSNTVTWKYQPHIDSEIDYLFNNDTIFDWKALIKSVSIGELMNLVTPYNTLYYGFGSSSLKENVSAFETYVDNANAKIGTKFNTSKKLNDNVNLINTFFYSTDTESRLLSIIIDKYLEIN